MFSILPVNVMIHTHDFRRSDGDTKLAEMTKRKLSADLVLTKAHIAIKQRDGKSLVISR